MKSAKQALSELKEGNKRYISGEAKSRSHESIRRETAGGQQPFAIILGCSDSRVPAELVFDQGVGDLFVIRVAGNIVAPSQIGSVEFAAEQFGTPLVVVLAHSKCGAVEATINELNRPSENRSPNLKAIVDRVQPSVQTLMEANPNLDGDLLLHHAVRANCRASAYQLRHGSRILEQLIDEGTLEVVAAEYDLVSGVVEFFD
ncbi:MAG: carbonic anhydrase [Lysobacteraceae bacterium]|nr:MAG: carbonic anhydrase [Xanthomonadaceae bacterium]